jgi:hypothetical protein
MRPAAWLNRVGLSQVSNDCRITFFSRADKIWSQGLSAVAGEVANAIVQSLPFPPVRAGRINCSFQATARQREKLFRFPFIYRRLVTCPQLMCPSGIRPWGVLTKSRSADSLKLQIKFLERVR